MTKHNPHGYCSPEYWEWEEKVAKQEGWASLQAKLQHEKETGPKCPHCGVTYGFNMGTGDCNCEDSDYD